MIKTELKLNNGITIISTEPSDPTKSRESRVSLSDETLKMILKMKQEIETLLSNWMKGSDGYKKIPNSPITGFYANGVTFFKSKSRDEIGLGIELTFDTNVIEKWNTLFEEIKKLDIIKAIETILKKYLKKYYKPEFFGSDYPLNRYDGEANVFWEFTTKSSLTV